VQKNADAAAMPDLAPREWEMLGSIAAAVLWMGVYPESFLGPMRQDIQTLNARISVAAPEGDARLAIHKAVAAQVEAHEGAH
jgi:NADH-quinone oxidoreductase subunit M